MRGVIYARYSSDAQREESIDAQIRENKEFAERHGIEIVGTYIDRALSAKTDNRPEFQKDDQGQCQEGISGCHRMEAGPFFSQPVRCN